MPLIDNLKFDEKGLIPAVIVDTTDNRVLTLCFMNQAALEKTVETGKVHVFRRSKNRLMIKGETSGHIQLVKEIFLIVKVNRWSLRLNKKLPHATKDIGHVISENITKKLKMLKSLEKESLIRNRSIKRNLVSQKHFWLILGRNNLKSILSTAILT